MLTPSIQTHNQIPLTIERNPTLNELFQKLDDTSELVKELDSAKHPTNTYPALYASMMLTGDSNDQIYDWITRLLSIDDHWNDSNQSKFEQALNHLDFDHKFPLLEPIA